MKAAYEAMIFTFKCVTSLASTNPTLPLLVMVFSAREMQEKHIIFAFTF
jgi:hypothetical protein